MPRPKKVVEITNEEMPEVNDNKDSEIQEEVFQEENVTEKLPEEVISETPIYVPDIPAQMIDISVPEQPKGETEIQFLQRILNKQHDGGFGRHLDDMINERIKELNNAK